MYENKFKNIKLTNVEGLDEFLNILAELDTDIELFAIGGTAMVLKNIKESTKDINFLSTEPYEKIKDLFEKAGLKEEQRSKACNIWYLGDTRIDIFYEEFILGIALPDDWKELSEHIKDIGKVKLYILNWYDIIITKIARSERRDIEDIIKIIKDQKINFKKLKERYYNLAEGSLISDYNIKFKHLEKMMK